MGRGCVVWPWLGRSGPRPPFASAALGLRFCWCRRTVLLRGGLELTTRVLVRAFPGGAVAAAPGHQQTAQIRRRHGTPGRPTPEPPGRRPGRPPGQGPPPGRRPKRPPSPRPRRGRGLLSTGPATRRPPTQPTDFSYSSFSYRSFSYSSFSYRSCL